MSVQPYHDTSSASEQQSREGELMFPGEDGPLLMRAGGQPITDAEALGVARRWVREANARLGRNDPVPDELPLPSEPGTTPLASFRVPRREIMVARAKSEMEGRSLTEVVLDGLDAYTRSEPGAVVSYVYRGQRPAAEHHTAEGMLPGEDEPLPLRLGGQPITDAEALGVARRWVREANARLGRNDPVPDELPLPAEPGTTPLASFRLPRRVVMISRAKAEMEGRSLTEVVRDLLAAYGRSEPGAKVKYVYRGARPASIEKGTK